jgi:hypothetical protein
MAPQVPRQVAAFRLEALDGELLLYHPGLTRTIRLNDTAALVWQLCDGRRTVGEITDLLRDGYPDEASAIEEDVSSVVTRLAAEGALTLG